MTFVAGIDMGAKSTKALILDGEKQHLRQGKSENPSGFRLRLPRRCST